jgi:hypothetical protein
MMTIFRPPVFLLAGPFLLLAALVQSGNAQDADSIRKAISEADKEQVRLLQEELSLKQKRNAEIATRIKQLKTGDEIPNAASDATAAAAHATADDRAAAPPLSSTTLDTNTGAKTNSIEKVADPKCSTFPEGSADPEELKAFSIFRQALCGVIYESKPQPAKKITIAKIYFSPSSDKLVRMIVAKTVVDTDSPKLLNARSFLLKSETARTDKQIGADAKSNGTTSIVSKGGIPAFFAFAVENGAATSSTDGTTMTFRVNPAGLLQTATGSDYVDLFEERRRNSLLDLLGKTSLGFSFDTKRGFPDTPTFTGDDRQLSAFSFRFEFINERSPKHSTFRRKWSTFVRDPGKRFFDKQNEQFKEIFVNGVGERGFKIPELQEWLDGVNKKLAEKSPEIVRLMGKGKDNEATDLMEGIIIAELEKLPVSKVRSSPSFAAFVASIENDANYVSRRNELFDDIAKGQVATFEYINFREPIKPDTHSLRFIWEKGLWRGVDFTLNSSLTFYNRKPNNPEVNRIRDFDFSGQFDIPLRRASLGFLRDSVVSFAGKFERLNTDIVSENGMLMPGTKGDIGVGQLKWTIPIGDTGLRLPLSFTFANRTELIKEKEIRGNFGLTIDFDSILARFRSFANSFPLR